MLKPGDPTPLPQIEELLETGHVLALNFPVAMNPGLARAPGVLLKLDFQRAVLQRIPQMAAQPARVWHDLLFICDEYHAFATVGETDTTSWTASCRSSNPSRISSFDRHITEVMVNDGGRHMFVERDGAVEPVMDRQLETRNLTVAIKNVARACGDEISEMQPLLDARLEDGSRAAMFPPCAVAGPVLTIRAQVCATWHITLNQAHLSICSG